MSGVVFWIVMGKTLALNLYKKRKTGKYIGMPLRKALNNGD